MSKLKPIEGKIPAIYRTKTIDIMLFAWVESKRKYAMDWEMPFNINKAVDEFMQHFEITEDDYSKSNAIVTYSFTMQKYLNQ